MRTTISTLPNQLRVVTTEMPDAQSMSVNIFVGAGSRYEYRRINGVSHYLEHMLFKGTPRRPEAMIISEAIEGAGGRTNAYTSQEVTCYLAKVPFEQAEVAMDVVSDIVQHPLLAPEEVERERQVIIEEIRRGHDSPGAWAAELSFHTLLGDQPLGWSIAGTEDTVRGITRQDLADYVASWYVPNNLVVSVAGNVRHDEVVALMGGYFRDSAVQPVSNYQPALDLPAEMPVVFDVRPISQANLSITLKGFGRKDPDRYIFTVLANLLGSGMSSRLFKEVRERRGLAYSVGCGIVRFHDASVLATSAGVTPEKLVDATEVILGEYQKLVDQPVGEDELRKARDYSVGSFRLGLEDTMSVARWIGDSLINLGEIQQVDDVVARLRAVTPDDIQRVARRLFIDNEIVMGVTSPTDETAGLLALLHRN